MRASERLRTLPDPDVMLREAVASGLVARVLDLALDEDTGGFAGSRYKGDLTSASCAEARFGPGGGGAERGVLEAGVVARPSAVGGVVCGLGVVHTLVSMRFPKVELRTHARDGDSIAGRTLVATVRGPAGDVLLLERTMLNLLGRLSGVSTQTARYVEAARAGACGRVAHVCDTRKTTPGLRVLEKHAVRCGGGMPHRMGLHDALLIKDNHLAGVGLRDLSAFVASACARARELSGNTLAFCEVEVDSEEQLREVLSLPEGVIDVALLDNMDAGRLRACCALRDSLAPHLLLEASGGITLSTIGAIAQSGVDRVSVGALTHSAVQLDFGLDIA